MSSGVRRGAESTCIRFQTGAPGADGCFHFSVLAVDLAREFELEYRTVAVAATCAPTQSVGRRCRGGADQQFPPAD
jgi:hypothetical protein